MQPAAPIMAGRGTAWLEPRGARHQEPLLLRLLHEAEVILDVLDVHVQNVVHLHVARLLHDCTRRPGHELRPKLLTCSDRDRVAAAGRKKTDAQSNHGWITRPARECTLNFSKYMSRLCFCKNACSLWNFASTGCAIAAITGPGSGPGSVVSGSGTPEHIIRSGSGSSSSGSGSRRVTPGGGAIHSLEPFTRARPITFTLTGAWLECTVLSLSSVSCRCRSATDTPTAPHCARPSCTFRLTSSSRCLCLGKTRPLSQGFKRVGRHSK